MESSDTPRVVVVGAGVAGLTAGIFTARHDFETLVVDRGESILGRNAHIENYPGFPAGVNSWLLLDMIEDQARRAGCVFHDGGVTAVEKTDGGFAVHLADDDDPLQTEYVIAASWSDASYLDGLDVAVTERGSKVYVDVDDVGRTNVDGLYAAGRIAEQYHQAIVAAGHGATTAVTLLDDSEVPFYHDWVAPEGYFTERGRDVPPGCEEIDEPERRRRERRSVEVMSEYFAEPDGREPTMHPSVVAKREEDGE